MANASNGAADSSTSTTPTPAILDKAAVNKVSVDISDMLKAAFDKHRELTRSHRELDAENARLKEENSKAKDQEKAVRNLTAELEETKYEMGEVKARLAKLSAENQKLRKDVDKWFQKSLKRETPIIPMLSASGQPVENTITPRTSTEIKASPPSATAPRSSGTGSGSLEKRQKTTRLVISDDGEFEELRTPTPSEDQKPFTGYNVKPEPDTNDSSVQNKKRSRSPRTPSPDTPRADPQKPLQTNTCKVCEAYWRAEDARVPGRLKTHDLPYCRVHGKKRPPCTPENFWKVRLSPPPENRSSN